MGRKRACPTCGRFMQLDPTGGWQCLRCGTKTADPRPGAAAVLWLGSHTPGGSGGCTGRAGLTFAPKNESGSKRRGGAIGPGGGGKVPPPPPALNVGQPSAF